MRHNNKPYQGINTLILWIEAAEKQYNAAYWMTFKQAKLLGGNIRKGERASAIFYSGTMKSMAGEEEITEEATTRQQENIKIDEIHATSEQQYKKFMKSY
jgi:antirestriction protein ArdC